MRRSRSVTVVAMLVCAVGVLSAPASAASPNHSLLLWKPGRAHTGVLKDGVYTRKRSFSLTGVSLAAASRSSLALYTRDTGRLRTGTFRGGVYTPVETLTIRSGFTHMAASCDTLILYNTNTGRRLVGTFNGGRFRNQTSSTIQAGATYVIADCDRFLSRWEMHELDSNSMLYGGPASGGDVLSDSYAEVIEVIGPVAATRDSSLIVTAIGGWGFFGTLRPFGHGGPWSGVSKTFGAWDMLAGNATTILFLNRDGVWCGWTMADGQRTAETCGDGELGTGWKLVTGGR